MSTLADALLRQIQQPQNTGYMNAFNQGQQQAYSRGLSGALASGAPREEVLSKLAYVDPKLAGQEMGVFTSGQVRETDAQRQAKMLNEAGPIRTKAIELANKIRSSLGQEGYDATEDFNALELLKDEFYTKSNGKKLDDRVFDLIEEDRRQGKYNIDQAKEGREQQGDVEGAVKDWRNNNIVIGNLSKLKNIQSFANQAKQGNAMAIKNLIAATSRLGSNEALSDSELQLMLSGDIGTKFDSMINNFLGTGTIFSSKDVNNAIKLLNDYAVNNLKDIKVEASEKANDLINTKRSSYTKPQLVKLLLEGLPSNFQGTKANASFAQIPSNLTDRTEELAPSDSTPEQKNTALGDLLKIR